MFVTLFGVGMVIIEKKQHASNFAKLKIRDISLKGVLFGFGGMFGQASGYVLSKSGMQTETGYLDSFSATQIRAIAAFVCFLFFFTLTGKWGVLKSALRNTRAMVFTAIASTIGPFLGVSLSLLILHYLKAGVASTFLSLVPVFIIPFSIFVHKEHVYIRAVAGAVTAVFGIYLLMS
jgi:drug/metabolite transporter (DMT)-like permease